MCGTIQAEAQAHRIEKKRNKALHKSSHPPIRKSGKCRFNYIVRVCARRMRASLIKRFWCASAWVVCCATVCEVLRTACYRVLSSCRDDCFTRNPVCVGTGSNEPKCSLGEAAKRLVTIYSDQRTVRGDRTRSRTLRSTDFAYVSHTFITPDQYELNTYHPLCKSFVCAFFFLYTKWVEPAASARKITIDVHTHTHTFRLSNS